MLVSLINGPQIICCRRYTYMQCCWIWRLVMHIYFKEVIMSLLIFVFVNLISQCEVFCFKSTDQIIKQLYGEQHHYSKLLHFDVDQCSIDVLETIQLQAGHHAIWSMYVPDLLKYLSKPTQNTHAHDTQVVMIPSTGQPSCQITINHFISSQLAATFCSA